MVTNNAIARHDQGGFCCIDNLRSLNYFRFGRIRYKRSLHLKRQRLIRDFL